MHCSFADDVSGEGGNGNDKNDVIDVVLYCCISLFGGGGGR